MSTVRTILKLLGVASMVGGVVLMIYSLLQGSAEFSFQIGGVQPELSQVYGTTRFYQVGGAVLGLIIVYFGFRMFRYVPKSEREEGPVEYEY